MGVEVGWKGFAWVTLWTMEDILSYHHLRHSRVRLWRNPEWRRARMRRTWRKEGAITGHLLPTDHLSPLRRPLRTALTPSPPLPLPAFPLPPQSPHHRTSTNLPRSLSFRNRPQRQNSITNHPIPPTLCLSREALTPSLWIDEEVYARFASDVAAQEPYDGIITSPGGREETGKERSAVTPRSAVISGTGTTTRGLGWSSARFGLDHENGSEANGSICTDSRRR